MNKDVSVFTCQRRASSALRPLIGVDIDGVMADFNGFFLSRVNNLLGTKHEVGHITTYDYQDCIGLESEFVYDQFDQMTLDGSYGQMAPLEAIGMHLVNELPGVIRFVTNRQAGCAQDTIEWLDRHGIGCHEDVVFVHGKKSQLGHFDYFVEDSLKNAIDMAKVSGIVFLVDCPYNQAEQLPPNMVRVKHWQEIVRFIKVREKVMRRPAASVKS